MASTWEAFTAAYKRQIAGCARLLLARWKVPVAVSQADIEQEVWLGAWQAWERWDDARGAMTREAFALCSGRQSAMRWIHGQRNSVQRLGTNPSRFPTVEAALLPATNDEQHEGIFDRRVIEPGQDFAVEFGEAVRGALCACRSNRERRALRVAIERGSMMAERAIQKQLEARS